MKSNRKSANLYQDKNIYLIISLTLMAVLGVTSVNPALPNIAKDFNVPHEEIGLVITAFTVPIAIGTPVFAVLADHVGRKQILVPSLLLFAIAGTLSAFTQDFHTLVELRFLQGIGAASLEFLTLTLIGDLYGGKMLTSAMAFNGSMIGISSGLFPLLSGQLTNFSWRYPFLLSLFAIPLAVLILTTLKLPKQTRAQEFNLKAYVKNTWRGINNRQVFKLLFVVASLFIMQFGAWNTFMPILAENSLGASSLVIGIILASMSLAVAFVASQLGLFARFLSEMTLIKVAFIFCGFALLITPALHNVWLLVIPSILLGAAHGMAFPATQAMLARLAPEDYRAGFMAVNAMVQALAQALGPALASIAFKFWGMPGVFYSSAGFALAAFVLFNPVLTQKQKSSTPTPPPTVAVNPVSTPTPPPTVAVNPVSSQQTSFPPRSASFTKLQQQTARLIHVQTNKEIELPQNISVIHVGKPNDRIPPDVDVSGFPSSEIVSRIHADIRVEGYDYYIEDAGSYNGTYVNNLQLLPGNRYKLRPGDRICLGKKELVKFLFQLS